MSIVSRATLKDLFKKKVKPLETSFASLIDSFSHKTEDKITAAIFDHDPSVEYNTGQYAISNGVLYRAKTITQGPLNEGNWEIKGTAIKVLKTVLYKSNMDAIIVSPMIIELLSDSRAVYVALEYATNEGNGIEWNQMSNFFYIETFKVPLRLLQYRENFKVLMALDVNNPNYLFQRFKNSFTISIDPLSSYMTYDSRTTITVYIYYMEPVTL